MNLQLAYVPHVGELNYTDTWLFCDDLGQPWGIRGFLVVSPSHLMTCGLWKMNSLTLNVTDCALLVAMIIQSLHLDANFAVPY